MVIGKGYQVLEPKQLNGLFGKREYFDFAVSIFNWLIQELHSELEDRLGGVQLDVIQVGHHSPHNSYPALGVRYITETQDIGVLIEATIDKLLQERSILELVIFIGSSGIDWHTTTAELMKDINE